MGAMLSGAGCIDEIDQSDSSPQESATPSPTRSPTDESTSTTSPAETCDPPDATVHNVTDATVTFRVTVTETGSRYRGTESPSATRAAETTPEETPSVTFEDAATLDGEEQMAYENIPLDTGRHVVEVAVEDGPHSRYDIRPGDLSQERSLSISISTDDVFMSLAPSSCGEGS